MAVNGRGPAAGSGEWTNWWLEAVPVKARHCTSPAAGSNYGGSGCSSSSSNGQGRKVGAGAVPSWAERSDSSHSLLPNFFTPPTTAVEAEHQILGLTYAQRFKGFLLSLVLSITFFGLAFVVELPLVAAKPRMFAVCFTLGSLCFMASFAMLRGPSEHLLMLCRQERLPFTILYLLSTVGTLHACLVMRSYFMVVAFSTLQAVSLCWLFFSMVPGGCGGAVGGMARVAQLLVPCLQACRRAMGTCLSRLKHR